MNSVGSNVTVGATSREWIGLGVLALPCFLYSMDLTVLNLAVPQLIRDLSPSSSELLWIVDIYGFLLAGFLIPMGTVGDRIGRRRLLMAGAAMFGIGSICAAFATSTTALIASRALLGVAGATLAPSTLALIRNMFHCPRQRTLAVGVWATSFSVGGVGGPLLGGLLLERWWWGSVFLLAVPVMLLLLIIGPRLLPESRDPAPGQLDLISIFWSLATVLLVVYGVKQLAHEGVSWQAAWPLLAGVLSGLAFVRRQGRLTSPLLNLQMFWRPILSAAIGTNVLCIFVSFGASFLIAQYLQLVLDLTPMQTAIWMAPKSFAFIVGCSVAPAIVRWLSPAIVIPAGLMVAAVGCTFLSRIEPHWGPIPILIGSSVLGLGIAPALTCVTNLAVSAAQPARAGVAAGVFETASELGGALGIAVLGAIAAASFRSQMAATLATMPPSVVENATDSIGSALKIAGQLPAQAGAQVGGAARDAFAAAFRLVSAMSACLLLTAAATIGLILRAHRSDTSDSVARVRVDSG